MTVGLNDAKVAGLDPIEQNQIDKLVTLLDRPFRTVLRDVCVTRLSDGKHEIVPEAYEYFVSRGGTRRMYFLNVAHEQLPVVFAASELQEALPFHRYTEHGDYAHSYDLPRVVQALALAERDGAPTDRFMVHGLSKGRRAKVTYRWLLLERSGATVAEMYLPFFDYMQVERDQISGIIALAKAYGEDLVDLAYDLMGWPVWMDEHAVKFYRDNFDQLFPMTRNERLMAYTLHSIARAIGELRTPPPMFSMTHAQYWLRAARNASPVAFISHEGAGQYMKTILTAQARRGNELLGKRLVRERGRGNVWTWKVEVL